MTEAELKSELSSIGGWKLARFNSEGRLDGQIAPSYGASKYFGNGHANVTKYAKSPQALIAVCVKYDARRESRKS